MTFLLAYLNVHYLILLFMVNNMHIFYEYIWFGNRSIYNYSIRIELHAYCLRTSLKTD